MIETKCLRVVNMWVWSLVKKVAADNGKSAISVAIGDSEWQHYKICTVKMLAAAT